MVLTLIFIKLENKFTLMADLQPLEEYRMVIYLLNTMMMVLLKPLPKMLDKSARNQMIQVLILVTQFTLMAEKPLSQE